jgi:hypothetical protein
MGGRGSIAESGSAVWTTPFISTIWQCGSINGSAIFCRLKTKTVVLYSVGHIPQPKRILSSASTDSLARPKEGFLK